jgi:hypothetical protein
MKNQLIALKVPAEHHLAATGWFSGRQTKKNLLRLVGDPEGVAQRKRIHPRANQMSFKQRVLQKSFDAHPHGAARIRRFARCKGPLGIRKL